MRKVLAGVLVLLGVLALAAAVLLPTVVVPAGKKTPLNLDITVRSTGNAQLLDPATMKMNAVPLRATRIVKTDKQASDSKYTTVDEKLCIVVVNGTTPDCPPLTDPRYVSETTDRVTADRKNAQAVNIAKYGEKVNDDTSVKHEGMAYKWPIDAKKQTYLFFNTDLKKAYPAEYKGTSKLKGLTVYEYVCETGDQPYKIANTYPGTYNDTRTVYVEPRTGVIVKGIEHQVQKISGGPTALDTVLTFDGPSIDYQANYAKDKINQLRLAQLWLPLILGVVGVALLVVGGLMLRRRRTDGVAVSTDQVPGDDRVGDEPAGRP